MHIHEIEVFGFRDGALSGNIALISDDWRINVPLSMAGDTPPEYLHQRLLEEALRLARRMPEFRAGRRRLSVAPALLARTGQAPQRLTRAFAGDKTGPTAKEPAACPMTA